MLSLVLITESTEREGLAPVDIFHLNYFNQVLNHVNQEIHIRLDQGQFGQKLTNRKTVRNLFVFKLNV